MISTIFRTQSEECTESTGSVVASPAAKRLTGAHWDRFGHSPLNKGAEIDEVLGTGAEPRPLLEAPSAFQRRLGEWTKSWRRIGQARANPILDTDPDGLKQALIDRLIRHVATDPCHATKWEWFTALSDLVRGYMAENWLETRRRSEREGAKVVCYLSLEFLLGRSLRNHLMNLGLGRPVSRSAPAAGCGAGGSLRV